MGNLTFADLLRRERRAQGLTQAELAERAQLSERAISDMERGLKLPQRGTLHMLTNALALSPEQVAELEAARAAGRQRDGTASAASRAPHQLPSARTSFIGRERVLADVRQLINASSTGPRLVTLTGPGGAGKTRVALEAAGATLDDYPDGVYFVGLASISDSRLVVSTVAQALGVSGDGREPELERLKNYLRDREAMLILDNFEQVLGAGIVVAELLSACPHLRVLVTSRAPLRLLGEQEFPVPPLDETESIGLFVERARAVKPDFGVTAENAVVLAEICRRLDGLPLAIELAAARTRLFEPRAMLAPLERRLQLLTGGARDAPARQQTLRSTIAWSYELLEPAEKALFRHLAVFVGGCSLEAAQAVCGFGTEVLELVDSLSSKNLLRPLSTVDGVVRVGMLETIREFGLEQLELTGETAQIHRRHTEYFLALAERAEPGLGGPDVRTWLDRLEVDHDNLRAAMAWSIADSTSTNDMALRLSGALARFWWIAGHFTEGSRWLQHALASSADRTAARMKALYGAAWLAHFLRDADTAEKLLQESMEIAEDLRDDWARAWILHGLGRVAYFQNDAVCARQFGQQSLRVAEAVGDRWLIAWAWHLLALAAHIANDDTTALAHYERSLSLRREIGHVEGILILHMLRGQLYHRAGDFQQALADYRQALDLARQLNSGWFHMSVLALFASLAAERQPELAARLMGAVTVMSESAHTLPIPLSQALFEQAVQTARRKLGDDTFAAAWAHGPPMSLDEAMAAALTVEVVDAGEYPAGLTPTEIEVLRRLAAGRTTRQIASELVVAVSTVDRHITHIYQKIGRHGRAAAAAFALQHGLT